MAAGLGVVGSGEEGDVAVDRADGAGGAGGLRVVGSGEERDVACNSREAGQDDEETKTEEGREAAHGVEGVKFRWVEVWWIKRGGRVFLCSIFKPIKPCFSNRVSWVGNNEQLSVV